MNASLSGASKFQNKTLLLPALLLSLSCGAEVELDDPDAELGGYALVTAASGFYFFPPIAPVPSYSGTFDPNRLSELVVELERTNTGTWVHLATFQSGSTPALMVRPEYERYGFWIRLADYFTDRSYAYRFRVLLRGREIATADMPAGVFDYIARKPDGRMTVSFRLEICSDGTHDEGGTCVENNRGCMVGAGNGTQTWSTSAGWSNCTIRSCIDGHVLSGGTCIPPHGQAAFTTPGSYSWVAPAGVTEISVVAIGGGGSGNGTRTAGGQSSFGSWVIAGGGNIGGSGPGSGSYSLPGGTGGTVIAGTGFNGGSGGTAYVINNGSGNLSGGGGAGGYTGAGGNGGPGGNGGTIISYRSAGSGGGVGIFGGFSGGSGGIGGGAAGNGVGGAGGSGGSEGASAGGLGGRFGGGAGGARSTGATNYAGGGGGALAYTNRIAVTPGQSYSLTVGAGGGNGGSGAVRIIWGPGRSFPNTNTEDVAVGGLVANFSTFMGQITLGSSNQRTFTFSNAGYYSATNIFPYLENTPGVTISQSSCGTANNPVTIAGGASCTFTLTFAPTAAGEFAGTVTVAGYYSNTQLSLPITGQGMNPGAPQGQAAFTSPGTYNFVVPAGVTKVNVVAIGGGGSGNGTRTAGGNSSFGSLVIAGGGGIGGSGPGSGSYSLPGGTGGAVLAGNGFEGGAGGTTYSISNGSGNHGGGGGAGGYTGAGQTGGVGGGNGGTVASYRSGGSGGGVGIYGGTTGGFGGVGGGASGNGNGGAGGSGGNAGANAGGAAGRFGGGAGGLRSTGATNYGPGGGGALAYGNAVSVTPGAVYTIVVGAGGGNGASGAVRVIWGPAREFPETNTGDVTTVQ